MVVSLFGLVIVRECSDTWLYGIQYSPDKLGVLQRSNVYSDVACFLISWGYSPTIALRMESGDIWEVAI